MSRKARRATGDVPQHRRGDSMKMKNEMKACLRWLAKYHTDFHVEPGMPELLLKTGGLWFKGRADSDEYADAKKWKKKHKPKAQDCFYNSQQFCMQYHGSRYFEGFVLSKKGLGAEEHAWVVMQDDRVVDFTMEAVEAVLAKKRHVEDLSGALYFGLEVPKEFIVETIAETGWYDCIAELFYADQIQRIAFSKR